MSKKYEKELIIEKVYRFRELYRHNIITNRELLDRMDILQLFYNCKIDPVTLEIKFKRGRRKNNG